MCVAGGYSLVTIEQHSGSFFYHKKKNIVSPNMLVFHTVMCGAVGCED